ARERGWPKAVSSKVRADNPIPLPSDTPTWVPCRDAGDRRERPSGLRPQPAQRSAGPSDDAVRACAPLQKTTDPLDTPVSAPARPGLPVPFANALSTSTSPNPHLRATTRSPAARCHVLQPLVPKLLIHI